MQLMNPEEKKMKKVIIEMENGAVMKGDLYPETSRR